MSTGTDTTSAQLRSQNAAEWARAVTHPLIANTADDSISGDAFEHWIVINTHFLRTYRRFMMVMGTLAPDTRASQLMFQAIRQLDEELRLAEQFAKEHGVDINAAPTARSMDYSSYCMASVGQGWARGVVVAFAVESLYFDAWSRAREIASPEVRYWDFIDMWSTSYQAGFVNGLSQLVDKLHATPEIQRIFRSTLRLELASWDEACGLESPDGI